jgi:hypothetical protein
MSARGFLFLATWQQSARGCTQQAQISVMSRFIGLAITQVMSLPF